MEDICKAGRGEEIIGLREDNIADIDSFTGGSVVVFPEINE